MEAAKNFIKKAGELIYFWYFTVSVASAHYMMDPIEKVVISMVTTALFALLVYAIITFFPGHILMMANFLLNQLPGMGNEEQVSF